MGLSDFFERIIRLAVFTAWRWFTDQLKRKPEATPAPPIEPGPSPSQPGPSQSQRSPASYIDPVSPQYQTLNAPYLEYNGVLAKSTPYRWAFNEEYVRDFFLGDSSEYPLDHDYLGNLGRLYGGEYSIYQTRGKKYQI